MHTSSASDLRSWIPLLELGQAQAALALINDIASTLAADLKEGKSASLNPELSEGAAGIAVFFAYLYAAGLSSTAREIALEYLNIGAEALAGQPMGPSLYAGFTGIAWAVQHVNGLLIGPSAEDQCSEIDLALEPCLNRSPWKEDFDLISGLLGLGVYCLERAASPVAIRCLELIVERLSELAQPSADGLSWFTSPHLLPSPLREQYPRGYYNVGVAHGVPGVIALLGRVQAAGIAQAKAGRLLEGAVHWLLRQQLSDSAISSFPSIIVPDQPAEDSRLAWCYGDAGIAAALLLAARLTGNKVWEQQALVLARKGAMRTPQSSRVVDACFCHGSAGLAHIFNRFYQATHDEVFSQTTRYWIERTLQFRQPGTGAAGYSTLTVRDSPEPRFQPRFGLIEGIAGIGLTLLTAVTAIEPCWDRIFLLDIPPMLAQP